MALVSDEYRFCYFAAPATGSTAFIKTMQKHGIGVQIPSANVVKDGKTVVRAKHSVPVDHRNSESVFWWHAKFKRDKYVRPRAFAKKNSFVNTTLTATERAAYKKKVDALASMSFADFLHDALPRTKAPFEVQAGFHDGIGYYIHQERSTEDFAELALKLGLPDDIRLDVYNQTKVPEAESDYRSAYNDDLRALVFRTNAPFFEKFPEYGFDGLAG